MAPAGRPSSRPCRYLEVLNPLTWRARLDLDTRSFLMMLKGALAPTIVIAIHQSSAIADITQTIGYLSALISVLSQGLMPRAKFMKIMFFDLLSTCVSASLCCLAVFCAVRAREHNMPPDARSGFSSDACAVSAIWLIFMIWMANTLRAWRPMELQDPMVAFSIFCSVTITRAGTFTTLSQGLAFIAMLLKGFMIGFAIATGVSLFILPITSRGIVFQDIKGYVNQIENVLQAQVSFVEDSELFPDTRGLLQRTRTAPSARGTGDNQSDLQSRQKQLTGAITSLNALHGKLQSDLFYSKDEIAWGKLSADDLNQIGGLLRSLLLPLAGMAMLPEIVDMIVKNEVQRNSKESLDDRDEQTQKQAEMRKVAETMHRRLNESSRLTTTGLHYVLFVLQLIKQQHLQKLHSLEDEESIGEKLSPLQNDFSSHFQDSLQRFYARRKDILHASGPLEAFTSEKTEDSASEGPNTLAPDPDVRQEFFLILYMGHLQESLLKATLALVHFADSKVADGTMKRSRLILPSLQSIRTWLSLASSKSKQSRPAHSRRTSSYADPSTVYTNSHQPSNFPDPEHMPPSNLFEKSSVILRAISHFLRSEQSVFGLRVAAASFCVGILAYLRQTQEFFIHQRCIWAMIVIVIGMNPTSGQTLFGFVARIAATVVSLVLSLIVWYIVDQKVPGVIVFLYLANVFEYYFYVKTPQYFGAAVIAIVTLSVIVGYELQVLKLGLEAATSNGQPYYPIYLFGPYKLAAVAAGCAISFVWVIFPYPITAKSTLRKAVGRSLFTLAKFYSCMHASVELWLSGELRSNDHRVYDDGAQAQLETARHRLFKEEMMLLNSLRMHSHFSTFEPAIGGKFPKPVYDGIIAQIQRSLTSMALMAHTTQNLDAQGSAGGEQTWASRLATIALQSSEFKSHATTSLLCHLSASVLNAQPLPPYLAAGDAFPLARQMQRIDGELLSLRHVGDEVFSAFVCLEVLRSVVSFSLGDLLGNVRQLVGELRFDFYGGDEREEERRLMEGEM